MSTNNSFADLVKRLNSMNNMTPDQERAELMEAANKAPKVLDDKEVTLADIAKLAGIKEYVEPVKHSKKAQKMTSKINLAIMEREAREAGGRASIASKARAARAARTARGRAAGPRRGARREWRGPPENGDSKRVLSPIALLGRYAPSPAV